MTGICAIVATETLWLLGLLDWVPFVGDLLSDGAAGPIAVLVLAVSLWVVVFVVLQLRRLRGTSFADSLITRRLKSLSDSLSDQTSLATRSELDHAHSDVSYGPVRALVWALPALGFLGTAAEMSQAMKGLGPSVGATGDYDALRDALVSTVIPPLGDAFGITLFALGASVVCHLLLTWTGSREQRILLEVEETTLHAVNRTGGPLRASRAPNGSAVNRQMSRLTRELSETRRTISDSVQISAMDLRKQADLGPLLTMISQQLESIRAELSRDLVLTRQPQTLSQG